MDDLNAEIAGRIKAHPDNVYSFIPLMYYRAMLDGKGAMPDLKNDLFPNVKPESAKEYIAKNAGSF